MTQSPHHPLPRPAILPSFISLINKRIRTAVSSFFRLLSKRIMSMRLKKRKRKSIKLSINTKTTKKFVIISAMKLKGGTRTRKNLSNHTKIHLPILMQGRRMLLVELN